MSLPTRLVLAKNSWKGAGPRRGTPLALSPCPKHHSPGPAILHGTWGSRRLEQGDSPNLQWPPETPRYRRNLGAQGHAQVETEAGDPKHSWGALYPEVSCLMPAWGGRCHKQDLVSACHVPSAVGSNPTHLPCRGRTAAFPFYGCGNPEVQSFS